MAKKELTVENNVAVEKDKRKKAAAVDKAKEAAAEEKPKETTVEFLASLAAVLVTGLFIITFVVQAFEIPSSSMENTLLIGDHVFVNRIQFAPKSSWVGPLLPYRDVRFRDIVVFLSPETPGTLCGEANHRSCLETGFTCGTGWYIATAWPSTNRMWTTTTTGRILTAMTFRRCPPTMIPMCGPTGRLICLPTFKETISWCRPTTTSPWATIAA